MNIVAIGIKPVARIRQKHHIHRLHFHLASKWCSMGSGLRLESGVATWGRQHLGLKSDCRLLPRQFRTYWLGMVCRDSWVQQSTRSWKRSCWPEDGSATWLGRHLGRVWPWSLLVLRLKKGWKGKRTILSDLKFSEASFPEESFHPSRHLCSPGVESFLQLWCEPTRSEKRFDARGEKAWLTRAAGICVFVVSFFTAVELTATPSLASLSTKLSIPDFLPKKRIRNCY